MSKLTLSYAALSLMVSGCYTEVLPDPECFNQTALPIPQEVMSSAEPALIFQYLSQEPDHCVNASEEGAGLTLCRDFYVDQLGYQSGLDFPSINLIHFVPISDTYGRCELRCEPPGCACLFDSDCGMSATSEPLSCLWSEPHDGPEGACQSEVGCTRCE